MGIALVLDQVHCSHAAHVVRVAYKLAAWGVQADFAAVSAHPAALGFTRTLSFPLLARTIVIIHTVVVFAQHGQVRGFGVSAVFVRVDMVNLASIGRHIAIRPRTDEVLCHSQSAQLVGREACFVEIHRAGGGVEKPDIELVTKGAGHRSVDEFSARHEIGRAHV